MVLQGGPLDGLCGVGGPVGGSVRSGRGSNTGASPYPLKSESEKGLEQATLEVTTKAARKALPQGAARSDFFSKSERNPDSPVNRHKMHHWETQVAYNKIELSHDDKFALLPTAKLSRPSFCSSSYSRAALCYDVAISQSSV